VLRKRRFVKAARGKRRLQTGPAGGDDCHRPRAGRARRPLVRKHFCDSPTGQASICTRSVDCSVRSLWRAVQVAVDQVVGKATLRDLLQNEREMNSWVRTIQGPAR